ncbi:MAG: SH3 domain-containing protein [Candidatus Acidiferrales bacterium]
MKKTAPSLALVGSALLSVSLWLANPIAAQAPPFERLFQSPKSEVDQAIRELRNSASGRLPILDGFVETTDQSLADYARGYYQCVVQATSDASGGTTVHVTAKITAWYSDPSRAQSGYRVLPSNGRLETDLLDRLEEILAKKTSGSAAAPQAAPVSVPRPAQASRPPKTSAPTAPPNTGNAPIASKSPALRSAPAVSPPPSVLPPPAAKAAAPSEENLSSLTQPRGEAEKRIKELSSDIRNLEEILHNQAHPTDLAVVRKSSTPVFAKPQANSPVLFSADAEDEFEILDKQGGWVHVRISGASRGWIRRAQLDLPEGFGDTSNKDGAASDPPAEQPFRVTREETHAFTGNWEALRGKSVRIIWVEPASASGKSSSAQAKRDFAKSLFLKAYKEVSSTDQTLAGVVIVFDSADGGQIAATLASIQQWQAGNLSEASFWQQCSLDPPESFQTVSKP